MALIVEGVQVVTESIAAVAIPIVSIGGGLYLGIQMAGKMGQFVAGIGGRVKAMGEKMYQGSGTARRGRARSKMSEGSKDRIAQDAVARKMARPGLPGAIYRAGTTGNTLRTALGAGVRRTPYLNRVPYLNRLGSGTAAQMGMLAEAGTQAYNQTTGNTFLNTVRDGSAIALISGAKNARHAKERAAAFVMAERGSAASLRTQNAVNAHADQFATQYGSTPFMTQGIQDAITAKGDSGLIGDAVNSYVGAAQPPAGMPLTATRRAAIDTGLANINKAARDSKQQTLAGWSVTPNYGAAVQFDPSSVARTVRTTTASSWGANQLVNSATHSTDPSGLTPLGREYVNLLTGASPPERDTLVTQMAQAVRGGVGGDATATGELERQLFEVARQAGVRRNLDIQVNRPRVT